MLEQLMSSPNHLRIQAEENDAIILQLLSTLTFVKRDEDCTIYTDRNKRTFVFGPKNRLQSITTND